MKQLGCIKEFQGGCIPEGVAQAIKGHLCEVQSWMDNNDTEYFRSARILVLTGRYRKMVLVVSKVHIELMDLPTAIEKKIICNCKGLSDLHHSIDDGCLHEEKAPFCGICGMPCDIYSKKWMEPDEFWGAKGTHEETASVSDCCESEDLFQDCNLTEPYDRRKKV
jgi:hypothetical protein